MRNGGSLKYIRKFEYLGESITVDLGSMLETLMSTRKADVEPAQMKKALGAYWSEIRKFPREDEVTVHFFCQIKLADTLVALVREVSKSNVTIVTPGYKFDGVVLNRIMKKYSRPFDRHFRPLVKRGVRLIRISKEPGIVDGTPDWIRQVLLPQVFMTIWTGLESYLEMRIKSVLLFDEKRMYRFAASIDEHLPGKWSGTNEKIKKAEFWKEFPDIIEDYLTFPYHSFAEKGKMNRVYQECFGFSITEFKRIKELQRFADMRHKIVHNGVAYLDLLMIDLKYGQVTRLRNLVLEFVEWIEEQIRHERRRP